MARAIWLEGTQGWRAGDAHKAGRHCAPALGARLRTLVPLLLYIAHSTTYKMAKKYVPGFFCVENMTLFVAFLVVISLGYLYYVQFIKRHNHHGHHTSSSLILSGPVADGLLENPYVPPLKTLDIRGPIIPTLVSSGPGGLGLGMAAVPTAISVSATNNNVISMPVPLQVPMPTATSTLQMPYRQVGILTRKSDNSDSPTILPLMGRNLMNGRDKWQYYTMSNSGANISTKLPVNVRGKSGMSEYGCDSVSSGDEIYVDGYQNEFKATVYDNASVLY